MRCLLIFLCSSLCVAGFGQNSATFNSGPNGFNGTATFPAAQRFMARLVTGAPYSADEVSEQVQTLADGTHITRNSLPTKIFRDSLGRTRTERPLFRGMAIAASNPEAPIVVEITDPVAQVRYTLDTINKVAHRQQLPLAPDRANRITARSQTGTGGATGSIGAVAGGWGAGTGTISSSQVPAIERPEHITEKLGTQTIEGVLVEGTRTTTTFPTGARGNDRPISTVNETWMSPDLKVMVLSKSTDPQSGEHTQKLTNISRVEPSPDLFQPPPEYTVVDEAAGFTIKWGTQP